MGLLGRVMDVLMVIAPPAGFLAQMLKMQKTRSSEGFSTLVPAVLLACNTLRLGFWVGKRFSLVLVLQSLVMIAAQFAVLHAAVRLRRPAAEADSPSRHGARTLRATAVAYFAAFWCWPDFQSYVATVVAFAVSVLLLASATAQLPVVVELFGLAALAVEASVGVPQVLRNKRLRSTAGLSLLLVLTWFAGDAFKTVYFIAKASPAQFLWCGLFQLAIDIVLLAQMAFFSATDAIAATAPSAAASTVETLSITHKLGSPTTNPHKEGGNGEKAIV